MNLQLHEDSELHNHTRDGQTFQRISHALTNFMSHNKAHNHLKQVT